GLSVGRSVIYVVRRNRGEVSDVLKTAIVPAPEHLKRVETYSLAQELGPVRKRDRKRIVIYPDGRAMNIAGKMEASGEILGSHVRFYSGLISKNGQRSIVFKEKPEDYSPERYAPVIESGKSLGQHSLLFRNRYVPLDQSVYKSGFDAGKYSNPKIFLNQTGYKLKAFFDTNGYFCLNNLHIGYPVHEKADLRFFTVLLNSRLMSFYYRIMSMEQGRVLAQTDIDFLEQLPVGTDDSVYREAVDLLEKHFTVHAASVNGGAVCHSCTIPAAIQRRLDLLLSQWYGVELD
ncbi:TaqI-like C-terminal specificity domain-containing protein, partial [candidate division KSB1 bacterium]